MATQTISIPAKPVVLATVGTPVPAVTCDPVFQTGVDGAVRYRDQDGTVITFPAGGSSHATVLASCPATGPTVAPTAEGHYYWTSTIGEKWCWIYGDAAPFICGPLYAETPLLNATFTSAGSVYAVRTTFTAPRNGNVLTTYTSSWLFNNAQVSLLDMRLRNLTAGTVVAEGSSSGSFSHAGTYEICVLTQVSPVSAGDILELSTRVFGSLALVHTSTLATCVFSYQG
jgi:hypothetical protein